MWGTLAKCFQFEKDKKEKTILLQIAEHSHSIAKQNSKSIVLC